MTTSLRSATAAARAALLDLHRTVLDAVRLEYERENGRVGNAEMLRLVAYDPAFAWLRPVSELGALDLLQAMPDVNERDAAAVRVEIAGLLSRSGERFAERYRAALQANPDLVLAHSAIQRAIAALPPSAPEDVPDLLTTRRGWKTPRRGR
jgi:hypothetical protein